MKKFLTKKRKKKLAKWLKLPGQCILVLIGVATILTPIHDGFQRHDWRPAVACYSLIAILLAWIVGVTWEDQ